MNILPVNSFFKTNFSKTNTTSTVVAKKPTGSTQTNLIEALHFAGIDNLSCINSSSQTQTERLLKQYMDYVAEHITKPHIGATLERETIKTDENGFQQIEQEMILKDIQLEQAFDFIKKHGGQKEFDELSKLEDKIGSYSSLERKMTEELRQTETNLLNCHDAEMGDIKCHISKITKYNPYVSLRSTLSTLEKIIKGEYEHYSC